MEGGGRKHAEKNVLVVRQTLCSIIFKEIVVSQEEGV